MAKGVRPLLPWLWDMTSMPDEYDPFVLAHYLDEEAKGLWGITFFVGGLVFVVGLVGIFRAEASTAAAYFCAGLGLLTFIANLAFDMSWGKAQELRRKIDLHDAFGWEIDPSWYNDLLVRCTPWVKKRARGKRPDGPYFASGERAGPRRALENVRESAWWSQHLAEKMYWKVLIATCVIVTGSVVILITTLAMVPLRLTENLLVYASIARSVTSLIMLVISLNLIKLTISYFKFAKAAAKCKEAAMAHLQKQTKGREEEIVTLYDYFLVRRNGPVVPTWLWSMYRNELNGRYPFKGPPAVSESAG